jgi:hypothetical protein
MFAWPPQRWQTGPEEKRPDTTGFTVDAVGAGKSVPLSASSESTLCHENKHPVDLLPSEVMMLTERPGAPIPSLFSNCWVQN